MQPYAGTPGKPDAFLVDLDGTIAHNDGHRGFFDWAKVGADKPHEDVIHIVRALESYGDGMIPIFVSGREDVCFNETHSWILANVYQGDRRDIRLFMRGKRDGRQDAIVKLEIFDNHIRNHFNVKFCLDDRNQVVEAYRSIGLRVLQVAPGDF